MRYDLGAIQIRKRNRLPHWRAEHAVYFVTFNLIDGIPARVTAQIRSEAEAQIGHIRAVRGDVTIAERKAIDAHVRARSAETLDRGHGACWLRDQRIASIVENALCHFDGRRYILFAWCVMPNYVHVVLDKCDDIAAVIHSWKSFTSNAANTLLGRRGQFWNAGYFDRCIRSDAELQRTIEYVASNPAKAGLEE